VRDLAAHEADLALRSSVPGAGPLIVRKLLELETGLYGSKEFVRRLPARARLDQVPLIGWSEELPTLAQALAQLPCPRAMLTNDYLAMCAAAEAGIGAMLCSSGQADVRHLERVAVTLPALPKLPLYLVMHQALRNVPRVMAVVEAIESLLSRSPSGARKATSPSPP
jgi:DNA-binding transcriptional LysR family regulator